jgi:hypothetical protein
MLLRFAKFQQAYNKNKVLIEFQLIQTYENTFLLQD